MLVHAVVSDETEKAIELFVRRGQAERFLEAVRADELELAGRLRVKPVELDQAESRSCFSRRRAAGFSSRVEDRRDARSCEAPWMCRNAPDAVQGRM